MVFGRKVLKQSPYGAYEGKGLVRVLGLRQLSDLECTGGGKNLLAQLKGLVILSIYILFNSNP